MTHLDPDNVIEEILAEAKSATASEASAYLLGASRDGTLNRLHSTLRISQANRRWLDVLGILFMKLGSRSWIYREGKRDVWVIETTCQLDHSEHYPGESENLAFVRGYFDSEGGIPRNPIDRFYIQFVQKDYADLEKVRSVLVQIGIDCGKLHSPSARVDPDYWRFFVLARSHREFLRRIGSWHPRKQLLLRPRLTGV